METGQFDLGVSNASTATTNFPTQFTFNLEDATSKTTDENNEHEQSPTDDGEDVKHTRQARESKTKNKPTDETTKKRTDINLKSSRPQAKSTSDSNSNLSNYNRNIARRSSKKQKKSKYSAKKRNASVSLH